MVPTGPLCGPAYEEPSAADQDRVGTGAAGVRISVLLPVVDHAEQLGERPEALVAAETAALRAPGVSEIPVASPVVVVPAQLVLENPVDEIDLPHLQIRTDELDLRRDLWIDLTHARHDFGSQLRIGERVDEARRVRLYLVGHAIDLGDQPT